VTPAGPPPHALELHDFGLAYRRRGKVAVVFADVDLRLDLGRSYLLVGPSGSGKSTFLRLLTGLWEAREPAPHMTGKAHILGVSVKRGYPASLRGRVTAVLQDEGLLDELSPRGNVRLALRAARRSTQLDLALLSQAGLPEPPDDVASLSGGMRKRVAVARALAGNPELCLFDEPTAGLDHVAARRMAELLRDTHTRGGGLRTTIVISHDVHAFAGLTDAVLRLDPTTRKILVEDTLPEAPDAVAEAAARPGEDSALAPIGKLLLQLGAFAQTLAEAVYRLPPVYPAVMVRTLARFALEPVLFACVGCGVVGGLATFFALRNNPLEGAFTSQVITGSGKVLFAVLVPLLAGFFFTARMSAGAAARLSSMTRSNQVAALTLMGIRPADYLLSPLIWAMVLAMPIVTAAGLVAAALASMLAAEIVTGASPFGWAVAFFDTVDRRDLGFAALKATGAAFFVAVLTYHFAVGPKRSGRDVGDAVNSSIVGSIIIVLLVHGGLTLIQFR
jgi:ABC-type multidrug transport system ATPase subunit/ABC-type transporter Mla maintaining outer membrane lipid asymmetry permease subunit MlaE